MIPVKQSRNHPNGDCLRSCICSILEIKLEDFPDFNLIPDQPGADIQPWYESLQTACRLRGYHFLELPLNMREVYPFVWDTCAIFIGLHPSSTAEMPVRHAIVGVVRGRQLFPLFDPYAPDGDPDGAFLQDKVIALCFLVPLDPATMVFRDPGNRSAADEEAKPAIIKSGNVIGLNFRDVRHGKRIQ